MAAQSLWFTDPRSKSLNVLAPPGLKRTFPVFSTERKALTYLVSSLPVMFRKTLATMKSEVDRGDQWQKGFGQYLQDIKKTNTSLPVIEMDGSHLIPALNSGQRAWFEKRTLGERCMFGLWIGSFHPELTGQESDFRGLKNSIIEVPEPVSRDYGRGAVLSRKIVGRLLASLGDIQTALVSQYLPEGEHRDLISGLMQGVTLVDGHIGGEVLRQRLSRAEVDGLWSPEQKSILAELSRLDPFGLFLLELTFTPETRPRKTVSPALSMQALESPFLKNFTSIHAGVGAAAEIGIDLLPKALARLGTKLSRSELTAILQTLVLHRFKPQSLNGESVVPILRQFLTERLRLEGRSNLIVKKVENLEDIERAALELLGSWISEDPGLLTSYLDRLCGTQ